MNKVIFLLAFFILLSPWSGTCMERVKVPIEARIDGPANLRIVPQGKVLLSLNNGVQVVISSFENDWCRVELWAAFREDSLLEDGRLKEGSILYDFDGKEIGRVINAFPVSDRNISYTKIKAYTYKDNIQKGLIKSNDDTSNEKIIKTLRYGRQNKSLRYCNEPEKSYGDLFKLGKLPASSKVEDRTVRVGESVNIKIRITNKHEKKSVTKVIVYIYDPEAYLRYRGEFPFHLEPLDSMNLVFPYQTCPNALEGSWNVAYELIAEKEEYFTSEVEPGGVILPVEYVIEAWEEAEDGRFVVVK